MEEEKVFRTLLNEFLKWNGIFHHLIHFVDFTLMIFLYLFKQFLKPHFVPILGIQTTNKFFFSKKIFWEFSYTF
jgi:hypothetical protein